jgi:hypothetical protein
MSKAFNKFGRYLEDPETGAMIYHEKSMKVKHDYKRSDSGVADLDKLLAGTPHGTLTRRIKEARCAICGSSNQVEMHHVRKASDIRSQIRHGNSTYKQWVGGYLRKQVPLSRYHHHEALHKGELNHADFQKISR